MLVKAYSEPKVELLTVYNLKGGGRTPVCVASSHDQREDVLYVFT